MRYWLILEPGPTPKPAGPFTAEQIAAMPQVGEETPVCPEGGTAWVRLREIPALQQLIAARNPPAPNAGPLAEPADASAEAEQYDSPSVWIRAGAYVIDTFIVMILGVPVHFVLWRSSPPMGWLFNLVLPAAYFTVLPVIMNGQTLGKAAGGIAIVRTDGSPLTYGRAFLRWIGYMISTATMFLGFLCALFTQRKRALHDFMADTCVVRVEEIGSLRKIAVVIPALAFPVGIIFVVFLAYTFFGSIFFRH
jgi:uncharacterized RDD family membrane protein YckC